MQTLISLLQQNARLSNAQLAVMLGKTEDEMGYLPEEYRERLIGYLRCLRDDMKK